jgi:regulator of replication initiation timing
LETEHVVNDLKGSAHFVEEKLKTMEIQASSILQHSGELISEQKRMHLDMQEYSEQLRNEQKQMHSEMQEQIKTDISGENSLRTLFPVCLLACLLAHEMELI